jgi:ferrous iron transport protein B
MFMKIALVGNPNSGKTTLFNTLTKLNQKIGNWPGVTVEKKSGRYHKDKSVEIVDLPGVYSLNPYSAEEKITAQYLQSADFDAVIDILDSTNLERNLSLTLQLLELKLPTILALNMEDELQKNGITLNVSNIRKELGAEAVLISALKNKNVDLLIEKAQALPARDKTAAIRAAGGTAASLAANAASSSIAANADEEQKAVLRHKYRESKIELFRTKGVSRSQRLTDRIDKIVTDKWLAYPIFAFVIWLMYYVSIQTVGALSIEGMEWIFSDLIGANLQTALQNIGAADWLVALIIDGIVGGVGAVLSFIPQILILFLFISLLEGCGYMSRVAFIMDRIFKRIGLSGKSFIPMIIGCGCSVPALMSTKTIESEAERKTTIMLTPFIPCSAKLPVFALLAGALFPDNSFVAPSMYFLGIFMVIICGLIINKIRNRRASADTFVMEMPQYRLPAAKNVASEVWGKAKSFLIRAGTIIFTASIVIWFLQSFSFGFVMVDAEDSILAALGGVIAPLFAPLGFGNWQSSVAAVTGLIAKETVVSTFEVLLANTAGGDMNLALSQMFSPHAAYAFMAFMLLSAPCVAAIGATRREMGSGKWTWITIGFQTGTAYLAALIINQAGNLLAASPTAFVTTVITAVVLAITAFGIMYLVKHRSGCGCGCDGCTGAARTDCPSGKSKTRK